MDSVQRTLQNIAHQVLGPGAIDTKMIQLWEHYIGNNVSTYDDFRAHLVKTPEFENMARDLFVDLCREHLGQDNLDQFPVFWSTYDHVTPLNDSIHLYIQTLPEYTLRLFQTIKDVFVYETDVEATNADLGFYSDLFLNRKYTVEDLAKDIIAGLHKKDLGKKQEIELPFEALAISKNQKAKSPCPFDSDALDAFESVFQRPMYVQEYFKYVNTGPTESWAKICSDHTSAYNRMRETFETYTGKTISEYYFVNRFLFAIDDPAFFENIINDIVRGSEYRNGMSQVLADKYMAMFDVSMSDSDIEYVFEIVKKQQLDIVNERLATILSSIKEETDTTISAIFKVYLSVLERPPDLDEITQYVTYYRNGGTDGELEKVLMRTLEFHDSIKKKIKSLYSTKKNKDVLPSTMFDILNRVIVKIEEMTMGTIDQTILGFIV